MKYYCVKRGRRTGLFFNWLDCKRSIHGFPNCEYKSFSSLESALRYMASDNDASCKRTGQYFDRGMPDIVLTKVQDRGRAYFAEPLLSVADLCATLGISKASFDSLMKERRIDAYIVGKREFFRLSEVLEQLKTGGLL